MAANGVSKKLAVHLRQFRRQQGDNPLASAVADELAGLAQRFDDKGAAIEADPDLSGLGRLKAHHRAHFRENLDRIANGELRGSLTE